MKDIKKIVFLSGTRADYGKIKSLIKKVEQRSDLFDYEIFVCGMHLLDKYGKTYLEIKKDGFKYFLSKPPKSTLTMDLSLSFVIKEFKSFVDLYKPDLILVHGDRLEALAGAIVGAFNNIKVAHIEGGEVSGTIDESIRHAISKLSHIHFVANKKASLRLIQLGENKDYIYPIGSPDIDIMLSNSLPSIKEAKQYYDIAFESFGILIFHPVTTDVYNLSRYLESLISALIESQMNFIVIYPNNDLGSDLILKAYKPLLKLGCFKIFPSIRFEYFLSFLKASKFIIGNSSSGIREASVYSTPCINIGNRQEGRYDKQDKNILSSSYEKQDILNCIQACLNLQSQVGAKLEFGDGKADCEFIKVLEDSKIWEISLQKKFIDLD